MALFKCTECGNTISDKTDSCPKCGCPVDWITASSKTATIRKSPKKIIIMLSVILAVLLIGGAIWWSFGSNSVTEKEDIAAIAKAIQNCDYVAPFHDGVASIRENNKYGLIDKKGNILIPCESDVEFIFIEGLSVIFQNGKFGAIDKKGKVTIPCKFDFFFTFDEGLAAAKLNDKFGYIDKKEKI